MSGPGPFVSPEEPSAARAIAEIRDELALFEDDESYYDYIIDQGRKLPPMPADWCDERARLRGCLAKVWLRNEMENGRIRFAGASDSTIVAGLVRLVLRVYSGRTPSEVLATDPAFLKDLGLIRSLTSNRSNGVDSMAREIVAVAQRARGRDAERAQTSDAHGGQPTT